MARFSERIGAVAAPSVIQIDTMSDALRNRIWNMLCRIFDHESPGWRDMATAMCEYHFAEPVDELPAHEALLRNTVKAKYYGLAWFEVYDLIEFLTDNFHKIRPRVHTLKGPDLEKAFNGLFEAELSGFRFISGELTPISSATEISSIEDALASTAQLGLIGSHEHLQAGLRLLALKPLPDYRNSIKESISAVEALAKQLGDQGSKGLSGGLKELGKKVPIHGALEKGLVALYGYTSDEDGIRHAMLEVPEVGYDEAKYMLVSCSAFVSYLAAKAEKAGLLARKRQA